MRTGDRRARDQFIAGNRPLVHVIARSLGPAARGSVAYEDLVAEGMIGLIEAADRFDPARARFSTHATYWIRMKMLAAIADQAGPVRMIKTRRMRSAWWGIGRVLREMFAAAEAPSHAEVAERLGLSDRELADILATRAGRHVSTDAPVYVDADEPYRFSRGETMTADDDPESTAADEDARRVAAVELSRALRRLLPRERRVIARIFGDGSHGVDVASELGVSRERVRQIKERALQKLAYALPRGEDGTVRLSEARARLLEAGAVDFSGE